MICKHTNRMYVAQDSRRMIKHSSIIVDDKTQKIHVIDDKTISFGAGGLDTLKMCNKFLTQSAISNIKEFFICNNFVVSANTRWFLATYTDNGLCMLQDDIYPPGHEIKTYEVSTVATNIMRYRDTSRIDYLYKHFVDGNIDEVDRICYDENVIAYNNQIDNFRHKTSNIGGTIFRLYIDPSNKIINHNIIVILPNQL